MTRAEYIFPVRKKLKIDLHDTVEEAIEVSGQWFGAGINQADVSRTIESKQPGSELHGGKVLAVFTSKDIGNNRTDYKAIDEIKKSGGEVDVNNMPEKFERKIFYVYKLAEGEVLINELTMYSSLSNSSLTVCEWDEDNPEDLTIFDHWIPNEKETRRAVASLRDEFKLAISRELY